MIMRQFESNEEDRKVCCCCCCYCRSCRSCCCSLLLLFNKGVMGVEVEIQVGVGLNCFALNLVSITFVQVKVLCHHFNYFSLKADPFYHMIY